MSKIKVSEFPDAFAEIRQSQGTSTIDDQNDPVTMLLRHKDVRKTAHNYKTFQSAAQPGRIVVPSEVNIRDTRQIPFELDPPLHGEYRALLDQWFKRPLLEDYQEKLKDIITGLIKEVASKESFEVISDFALPLQSKALTLLLNIPLEISETWIAWGTHVFRSEDDALDGSKAQILYDYIDHEIDKAIQNPGEDLYSVLLASEAQGRKLTKEEVKGVMILTFAGGRDTVINAVTNTLAYLADHPQAIQMLKQNPEVAGRAVEELIRYFAPLTHMGRQVTEDTVVCEHTAKANSRVSLCWASANRDETVFEKPNEVILDRQINPHVSFGFSHHNCLGATHARQIMKILLQELAQHITEISVIQYEENIENWGNFKRKVGFDSLEVKFIK